MKKKLILSAAVVSIAAAAVLFLFQPRSPNTPSLDIPGVQTLPPLALAEFTLIDHTSQVFDNSRLKNKWTFIFFGYTHCPDVCPTTLGALNNVYKALDKLPNSLNNTQFVFVSVDPHRDTPERLAEHMPFFNPAFIGVTGDSSAIDALGKPMGVIYDFEDKQTGEIIADVTRRPTDDNYLVNHYAAVFIIDPQARLVADILPPHGVERVTKVFQAIKQFYGS